MSRPRIRRNGAGSIYRLKKDGSWRACITLPDGRRLIRKPTRDTEDGARELLRELLRKRDGGLLEGPGVTFRAAAEEWLKVCQDRQLRPRSLEAYAERLAMHIWPRLGEVPVEDLKPAQIQLLYRELLAPRVGPDGKSRAGLSPRSIHAVHQVIYAVLRWAVDKRDLARRNVAALVELPRYDEYEPPSLSVDDVRRLLVAMEGHQHGALWTFLIGTGCRFGEAAGLQWRFVELETKSVRIQQAAVRMRGEDGLHYVLSPPKSKSSVRTIPLVEWVVEALRHQRMRVLEMRLAAGAEWSEYDLVFPRSNGSVWWEAHVLRSWHLFLAKHGFPRMRMHDLRHLAATLQFEDGTRVQVLQRLLGHANETITNAVYVGRDVPTALRQAADRYGRLLDPHRPRDVD